jgi:hypothetical protein
LNAISGPFVTLAKAEFNSQNANIQKWSAYIKAKVNRQGFLERALDWVSKGDIGVYMSAHRHDHNINELEDLLQQRDRLGFNRVHRRSPEMRGLEWGRLYEEYHGKSYDPKKMWNEVERLAADSYVTSRKGIFEYLLGGSAEKKLLVVRVFDDRVKQVAIHQQQTQAAQGRASPTVRSAQLGTPRTRAESISSTKWTPTTSCMEQRRRKLGRELPDALHLPTIRPKVIDNMGVPARRVQVDEIHALIGDVLAQDGKAVAAE